MKIKPAQAKSYKQYTLSLQSKRKAKEKKQSKRKQTSHPKRKS
jgi:hypothetical protein